MSTYKLNEIVKGKVSGLENYGIFIELDNGYIGLIHISEISEKFVSNINNFVDIGEQIYVKIYDIDHDKKQVKLTIKNINYRYQSEKNDTIEQTISGFSPLFDNLEKWVNDKKIDIKLKNF
ncbi:MAG: S1 RNA-binding domain-containing protein [Bacilli bacterium]